MITKKDLKKAWEKTKKVSDKTWNATKQGYGKSVAFTQKYAPIAEQRFGRMANIAVGAFQPTRMDVQPDFRVPKNDVQFERPRMMRRERRHDFGKLSFDLG